MLRNFLSVLHDASPGNATLPSFRVSHSLRPLGFRSLRETFGRPQDLENGSLFEPALIKAFVSSRSSMTRQAKIQGCACAGFNFWIQVDLACNQENKIQLACPLSMPRASKSPYFRTTI